MPAKKTSPSKAAAARANGAKSTGPITRQGKARSAMNSFKHGVYSASLLLPGEDPTALDSLRTYYAQRFQPQDPVEADLVEVMIISMWRLRRTARIDTGILLREFKSAENSVSGFKNMSPADQSSLVALRHLNMNGNALSALDRQESKLYRHFSRAMSDLLKLRKNFPLPQDPDSNADCGNEPTSLDPDSGLTTSPTVSYPEIHLVEARQPSVTANVIPICTGKAAKGAGQNSFRRNRDARQAA